MCTLVIAWKPFENAPIAVAANRDERFDRSAHPPQVTGSGPKILAPGDEKAGGTWIGVNEHRLFAGVTNRWLDTDRDPTRSRGLLVRDVLQTATVERAIETVTRSLETDRYDGFNLVVADGHSAVLLEYDGSLEKRPLDPGVHVVVNTGADGRYTVPEYRSKIGNTQGENADAVRKALQVLPNEDPDSWLDRAKDVLGDHEYGVCIHGDSFGTASTSLIAIDRSGTVTFRYADGPPCEHDATPVDGHI